MSSSVEISGQTVFPGTPVNVKWLNNWYEGEVLELARQNDLYQVKDSGSGYTILLDKSQFKVIDTSRPTHEQYSAGSEIAYYDSNLCTWSTGTIEEEGTKEVLLVKWKRDTTSNPCINWFEMTDIAPIITNEAYGIENTNEMTSQSKLQLPSLSKDVLLEDVLDERPRHRKNSMFHETSTTSATLANQKPFESRLPSFDEKFEEELDSPNRVKGHRTSVSMKRYYSENFNSKLSQHTDVKLEHYLQNQAALLHGKIDHSLLPPVWSYMSQPKGIPPHPSSRFFRHVISNPRLPHSSGNYFGSQGYIPFNKARQFKRSVSAHLRRNLSKSPTPRSESAASDVAPYAQLTFNSEQRRTLKHQTTDMSARPLPSLPDDDDTTAPYEVPLSLSSPSSWTNLKPLIEKTDSEEADSIVNIIKTPTIVSSSKNEMMVSAGGTITLFCEATSDVPITYEWSRNGQKLTNNDARVAFPTAGSLQLFGLCLADAGIYQCEVSNQGGSAVYKCKLYVEEESLKRSFSREYGLNKLAKDLPQFNDDNKQQSMDESLSLTSISIEDEEHNDDFHSQAPAYDDYPLNMVRHTLSLASMSAAMDQDEAKKQAAAQENDEAGKKKKKSKSKKESNKEREKNKRRHVSNVLMNDVQDYLGGYGEDYGNLSDEMILTVDLDSAQKKAKPSKKKLKEKKKSEKKKNKKSDEKPVTQVPVEDTVNTTPEPLIVTEAQDNTPSQYPVMTAAEDELVLEYKEGMVREAGEGQESETGEPLKVARSQDSIDAHPSFESLLDDDDDDNESDDKERQAAEGEEHNVSLPSETQHYTEAVRRLQESAQEYEEEHFGKDEKKSRRGPFSRIFKSPSKQQDNLELTMI